MELIQKAIKVITENKWKGLAIAGGLLVTGIVYGAIKASKAEDEEEDYTTIDVETEDAKYDEV